MKKPCIIILLFLFNCGTNKSILYQRQDIYSLIKNDICEVSLPENWVPAYDVHRFLFFKPKRPHNNLIENSVSIYSYTNVGEVTLKSIADNEMKMFNSNPKVKIKNISTERNKFGETLIYNIVQYWNSNRIMCQMKFFRIEGSVYIFKYKSLPPYYDEHLPKANFIFENLAIKTSIKHNNVYH